MIWYVPVEHKAELENANGGESIIEICKRLVMEGKAVVPRIGSGKSWLWMRPMLALEEAVDKGEMVKIWLDVEMEMPRDRG